MTTTAPAGPERLTTRPRADRHQQRMTYSAHGLTVSSAWPLAWLHTVESAAGPANITFRRLRPAQLWTPHEREFVVRDPGHLSVALDGNRVALWSYCGAKAQFERARVANGLCIDVYRPPGLSRERFEHTLLHAFLPNALVASGECVLHAASVVVCGKAYLFAGESGMGKSTLAAGLAGRGLAVLSEDIARLDWHGTQLATYASYPGARLRSNSFLLGAHGVEVRPGRFGLPKHHVHKSATPATRDPFPVAGLFILGRSRQRGPAVERLGLAEALRQVLQSSFLQTLPVESRSREAIERSMRILRSCPVDALAYRRAPEYFDRLLDQLIGLLEARSCASAAGAAR